MIKVKVKEFLPFSFCIISQSIALGQSKICEIKYNERGGAQTIEKKINTKNKHKQMHENDLFNCYRIGLEHDQNRKPIFDKPIFACCKDI